MENASSDSKYLNEDGEFDQHKVDVEVDQLYELYIPVMTGLASSTAEVKSWSLDKRILMGNLAQKILDEKVDRQSLAVESGIVQFWNAFKKAKKQ